MQLGLRGLPLEDALAHGAHLNGTLLRGLGHELALEALLQGDVAYVARAALGANAHERLRLRALRGRGVLGVHGVGWRQ